MDSISLENEFLRVSILPKIGCKITSIYDKINDVVIVTGAESGIGKASATRFAQEGAIVYGFGLRNELGQEWVQSVQDAAGTATFFACDVTKIAQVEECIKNVISAQGRIDVLVNNAARFLVGDVTDTSEEDWDSVLAVNLKSIFLTSKFTIPTMKKTGGAIINIASVHAFASYTKYSAYAASKGAVVALSRQMAIDHTADGIRVNSVVVGGVKTDMSIGLALAGGATVDNLGFIEDPKVLGRTAHPSEIAAGITYLASPDASFVVGSPFWIDGGLTADL